MFRLGVLYLFFVVLALWIVAELILLKVFNVNDWKDKARKVESSNAIVEATRGDILDEKGRKLACSVPNYRLYMDMLAEGLTNDVFNRNVDSLSICLSRFFRDKSPSAYKRNLRIARQQGRRYYMINSRRISFTELQKVNNFPLLRMGRNKSGFVPEQYDQRKLPFGSLASRTIGKLYGESSKGGMVGLERAYDEQLRGTNGLSSMKRISGRWIPEVIVAPVDGLDLVTHLDIAIQDVAEHALRKQLIRQDAHHGVAILMEVKTGGIKAIVNLHRQGKGVYVEDHFNYAIGENAEPGSTFKLFTIMAALEDGEIELTDSIDTGKGAYKFYDRTMRDSQQGGYGWLSVQEVFEKSSNIGISRLIDEHYKSNPEDFVDELYSMEINKPLEIEIKGEGDPVIKYPGDETWSGVTLPWMSIGYEVQMSPLHTLAFYNAVANKGKLVRPQFAKGLSRNGKMVDHFSPEVLNSSICSRSTISKVHQLLLGVVENGTANNLRNDRYSIAGKTGTAQVAKGKTGYKSGGVEYQASFVGYFPADKPRYSCIVVVNAPSNSIYYGNIVAGSVFREIADRVFASDFKMNKQEKPSEDLIKGVYPFSKGGTYDDLMTIYDELDFDVEENDVNGEWVSARANEEGIGLKQKPLPKGVVPAVIGMGARDAVSILENLGLNVHIQGVGKVVGQSLKAGSGYRSGNTIFLKLD
jgi:cell division protein FtsI (penicillin-binding protein 3)